MQSAKCTFFKVFTNKTKKKTINLDVQLYDMISMFISNSDLYKIYFMLMELNIAQFEVESTTNHSSQWWNSPKPEAEHTQGTSLDTSLHFAAST